MFSNQNSAYEIDSVHNVIVDFLCVGDDFSTNASALSKKYDPNLYSRSSSSNTVELLNYPSFIEASKNVPDYDPDKKLRIYLVGHCVKGNDFELYGNVDASGNAEKFDVDQLANDLLNFINQHPYVSINLVSCEAASDSNNEAVNSFAAKLHAILVSKAGRDIPVVARNLIITVVNSQIEVNKYTYPVKDDFERAELLKLFKRRNEASNEIDKKKLNDEIISKSDQHYPGSKLIFTLDKKGNQICIDAYDFRWKLDVLISLKSMAAHTKSPEKRALLNAWYKTFKQFSMEEIYQTILDESKNPKSVLKKIEGVLSKFFSSESDELKACNDYIDRRNLITKHMTLTGPTGRKLL